MSSKSTPFTAPFWSGGTKNEDLVVADVYNGQQTETKTVSAFKSVASDIKSSVISSVKGSKLTDLTKIVKTGTSLSVDKDQLMSRLESLTGVKFSTTEGVIGELSDGALSKISNSVGIDSKRIITDGGEFINLAKGASFKDAKDYTNFVSEVFDTQIGRSIVDNYAQVAMFGSLVALSVKLGLPDAIDNFVDKMTDVKEAKKALIESLETAARNGDIATLKKIKDHIGPAAMRSKLPNIVQLVLQGYDFPTVYDEVTNPNYASIYNTFVEFFNEVDPDWVADQRAGRSCSKLTVFGTASKDSITVFSNYGDYVTEALIAGDYLAKSVQDLSRKQFSYTYISS